MQETFAVKALGDNHSVYWIAKVLSTIKIGIYEDQLQELCIHDISSQEQFLPFCPKPWLKYTSARRTTISDLKFSKKLAKTGIIIKKILTNSIFITCYKSLQEIYELSLVHSVSCPNFIFSDNLNKTE